MDGVQSPADHKAPRVQTAARTVELPPAVARVGPSGMFAKKITEELKLPGQVVNHLLHTLVFVRMLGKVPDNSSMLGLVDLGTERVCLGHGKNLHKRHIQTPPFRYSELHCRMKVVS
jgi:hypothetical protein